MDLEGYDFEELARRYGTPYYLYDMDQAVEHLRRLRQHLPDCVDVYYCIKANPNRAVMRAFKDHVPGLDISSIGEMDLAQAVGYSPTIMSFAGPGKGDHELRRAIEADIQLLSIESHSELERAVALSAQLGKPLAVTIRINPQSIPNAFMMKMGGRPSQFGIPEEDVDRTIELAQSSDGITLHGIHIFSGTQCLDAPSLIQNIGNTLDIAARVARQHDLQPQVINLGGGFGVPYFPGQEPLDVDALSRELGRTVSDAVRAEPRLQRSRFILELGRFLIGSFGIYVARVIDVKQARGKRFVIMDGGMHHCFAATGNFGQLVKKNYLVQNLSRPDAEADAQELVGPLCTPLDSMARNIQLPRAEPGDLLCYQNTGAYCYTASPLLFLAHDTPAELVRYRGEISVARERQPASAFS